MVDWAGEYLRGCISKQTAVGELKMVSSVDGRLEDCSDPNHAVV